MPIGLGLAASHHTFTIFNTVEEWENIYRLAIRNTPQPPEAAAETPEVIQDYIRRTRRAKQMLRDQLAAYRPDLLVIIGGDQTEMFDRSNVPNFMIYTGETAWGHNVKRGQDPTEETLVRYKVDAATSRWLLSKLVTEEGFDIAFSDEQTNLGGRARGLPHAFVRPASEILPRPDLPTVLVYENTYDPPSVSAERCYALGQALARLLKPDPRRIAILGSGGLSHDPGGPRAGWVDEPLDRWFLDQIAHGNGQASAAMYKFDSLTMRSGTGEIRAWITAAGAMEEMGVRAQVIDYLPAHHAVTGTAWAYWPEPKHEATRGMRSTI
jgi:protocatechuate 4,5-dioxygenase beta chain